MEKTCISAKANNAAMSIARTAPVRLNLPKPDSNPLAGPYTMAVL